jgi:hypothetical protein
LTRLWLGLALVCLAQVGATASLEQGRASAVPAPDRRLTAEENGIVGRWLKGLPSLRLATEADCTDQEYLAVMRRDVRLDFDPYLARGDFNGDGRGDFAVLIIDLRRSAEGGFAVAIFNAPFDRASAPSYFENVYRDVGHSYLEWNHERRGRLFLGKYESHSVCIYFIPRGSGYRFEDCGTQANKPLQPTSGGPVEVE